MRYSFQKSKNPPPFDCNKCTNRDERNCQNRHRLIDSGLEGTDFPDWLKRDLQDKLPTKKGKFPRATWKLPDFKLYECPLTWITKDTYKILELLFLEENPTRIFPGTWLDQPKWWIEAIQIYKTEKMESIRNG